MRKSLVVATIALATAFQLALGLCSVRGAETTCGNGAPAEKGYCKYFFYYREASYTDPRLARAMSLGQGETTRSVAMILGVSKYPNAEDPELPAAKIDVEKLKSFLRDRQHFDEIILLEDEGVSLVNINYFLQAYLPQVAQHYTKVRVLLTYTGHGVASGQLGTKSFMVLSQAKDANDLANLLSLGQLREYFSNLAPQVYQFLALVNSCFGGDVFAQPQGGGNIFVTNRPAANAVTAGAPDELVYSEGTPGKGSIFFEGVIDGVDSGKAAAAIDTSDLTGKSTKIIRDVVRLGDLFKYLTDNVEVLNEAEGKSFSEPWEGSVEPPPLVSKGGFFFLSGGVPEDGKEAFGPVQAPSGAVSSEYGRPDVKVFNRPYEYPVQGVDVSQSNGKIDWKTVQGQGRLSGKRITFVFERATMGAELTDETFHQNWEEAQTVGLIRGAYHVYDFCEPVEAQINNIEKNVPIDETSLPLAVDLEFYPGPDGSGQKRQSECLKQEGPSEARESVKRLLGELEKHFKKQPVIIGDKNVFGEVLDEDFARYSVWLHDYRSPDSGTELPGRNPWTFWQYTNAGHIDGIAAPVDASAFFGTPDDFSIFRSTGKNISLEVVYDKARAPE